MTKIFLILFIILTGQIRSQTNQLPPVNDSLEIILQRQSCPSEQNKYKTLHFYSYGVPSWYSQCEINLRKQYGFDEIMKAGCYARRGQMRRWERHNYKIEKEMEKRHGENWHKKYDAELANCSK
jgi:hypothetical protein